jgi:hypothetical protein
MSCPRYRLQRARNDGSGQLVLVSSPTVSSASQLLVSDGRLFFQDGQQMVSLALRPAGK